MQPKKKPSKKKKTPVASRGKKLSHVNAKGEARMVDVSSKPETVREAVARGVLTMSTEAFDAVSNNKLKKGDLLAVARLAGIQAAKETGTLIPLCHPIPLEHIEVLAVLDRKRRRIDFEARARARWSTGVEMEALTAVAVAGLTAYDMIKAMDRTAVLSEVRLISKSGGRSGVYKRAGETA